MTSVPIDESRNGFFVLDKAAGFTSHDAVKTLSRALGLKKAGHSGTLDRFATGVLPILSGRYTRLMRFFMEGDKSYRAVIRFGAETDTLDPEGRIISRSPVPSHEAVESVLHLFRGDIMQAPPSFSAVHIDGERAWKRALSGERVELAERPVRIHRLEIFSWEEDSAVIEVDCSKGTYIRSLARDIARAAGSVAHLSALRRTRAAGIDDGQAKPVEAIEDGDMRVLDKATALGMGLSTAELSHSDAWRVLNGRPIESSSFENRCGSGPFWAVFSGEGLLAIMTGIESDRPRYEAVIGTGR